DTEIDTKATPSNTSEVSAYPRTVTSRPLASIANRLFENQKNLMMGKRKADDLSMSAFSETKKVKTSPGSSPAATPPSMKSTSKKKSSIENIIERIRTEKTMSRGGHSGAARSLVLDTAGPDLPQFSETDTSSLVKKENKGNEFPSSAIQSDSEPIDLSVKCPKENKCPQTESKDFNAQSENASEDTSIICLKDEKQDLEITAGCAPAVPKVDEKEKKISGMKQADDKEKGKTSVKQEDDKEKKRYGIKQVEDKEKKKSSIKQEDNQKNEQEQIGGGAKMEKQQSKSAMKKEEQQCIKRIKSTVKKYKKNQSPEEKKAAKIMRQRKNKLPIACRRTKREASLNAATLKAIKVTVAKSVEEKAEKKRKAALARLARAKELVKTKKKLSGEFVSDQSSGGSDSESLASENVDVEAETSTDTDGNCENNQSKAKKGALFRAARTHVAVESKTVVENTMPSPRWCECCQSTYYPSQPSQNTQVWRIKQLVDKDTSNAPAQIQSSSNHFIAAHASCEVRPYSSPSHVSVLDSNPYVGQLVPHGRIQCSACSCGHSGMFHTSCQNCSLGGVLPCQRYGNTYSVTYPHSHGSYIHCGCGSCYSSGTYHHTVGQTTLIHQPQMPLSTESPILLHHPVPIQVTHDSPLNSHPVSLTTLAPHDPPSLTHQLSKPASHPGEPSKGVGGLPQSQASSPGALSRMCQLSQGEVTNVSILASSSPTHSDHEIVDVGSREDIVKSAPCLHLEQAGISVVKSTFIKKTNSNNQPVKREKDKSIDQAKKKKVKFSTQNDKPVSIEKKKKNIEILKEKAKKLSLLNTKKDKKSENVKFSSHSHKTNENKVKKDKQQQIKVPIVPKDGSKKSKRTVSGPKEPKSQTGFLEIGIGDKERAEVKVWHHGWIWDGEAVSKKVINIFDGQPVQRKCYQGIVHEDGDSVQVKDCVLVCAGRKDRDLPYVAKVTNLWEEPTTGEMMMSVLWFYRPEHAEGGRRPEHLLNEVFAAKHRDETGVACIEDKGYVLTYNEYCRYMAEVERVRSSQPPRVSVVPTHEDPYPHHRIPPVDADPETIFLCRQVYDIKLKRVLKNPS
ncbi:BAHD1-like protein, partial [Mya arenaria]